MGAIETSGLTKLYGETTAVDGLDISVASGSVYGFLGPNGAGKTTTIEMLTTLTPPTAGDAFVVGTSVRDRDRLKPHVGYLPHDPPLYDEFTAREQLAHVADLRQMDPDQADSRIATLLERVGLVADADTPLGTFSEGMRRKTGLVQALLHEPSVLFLDEPTSGLDPRSSRSVLDLIAELAADGTTVFLSSHIMPVVEDVADTVGVLYQGRLVAEGPPTQLGGRTGTEGASLEEAFLEITTDSATLTGRE